MIVRMTCILMFLISFAGGAAMAVEEPKFVLVKKEGPIELRDYPAVIAAEVTVGGTRSEASSAGFRLLAGYIFGANTRKQSIAMTAPVVQSSASNQKIAMTAPVVINGTEGKWKVRFIMPSKYTLDTLPKPNDPNVLLFSVSPVRMAVIRFSGLAREAEVENNTKLLREFIAKAKLETVGDASLARYNPPWTPWFMRRNEIMIPVSRG